MNKDTWLVFIAPAASILFPVIATFIGYVFNKWVDRRRVLRKGQFDSIDERERAQIFSDLSKPEMIGRQKNHLQELCCISLHRSIGLPYSVDTNDKILRYISLENISFKDPSLNCFLDTPSLICLSDGFQQTHKKRKKLRLTLILTGLLALTAILYGFSNTALWFYYRSDVLSRIIFVSGTLSYTGLLIFIGRYVIRSLWQIEMSKKFWRRFRFCLTN